MDLRTYYLGLELKSPLVASASPLAEELSHLREMEDAGAAAVVLPSLFEEQIIRDQLELHHHLTYGTDSFAEALDYFPMSEEFHVGPNLYLEHIRQAKAALDIPVIASLNGRSIGGWTGFARQMEEAGADAIELNIYRIAGDIDTPGQVIEDETIEIVKAVRNAVSVPVAVKISPFYSSVANVSYKLVQAGANGLVLFNRFYQPDIDLEALEVRPNVLLSTPQALRLPLRWIALLHGRVPADLAATGGIHTGTDAIKMLLVGASVTMMASALFKQGIGHFKTVEAEIRQWMEENEYESVRQMQGSLSQLNSPDPASFERAQYLRAVSRIPDQYL